MQETDNPYITKDPVEANAVGPGLGPGLAPGQGPGPGPGKDFTTPRKMPQFTYVPKVVEVGPRSF